jgi:glycosidase
MAGVADDTWEAHIETPQVGAPLWYRFIANDGANTAYYNDGQARDGGVGEGKGYETDSDYALVAYDPAFKTPDWAANGIVYQIFPDRFNNGDPSNDKPAGSFIYGGQTISRQWGDKPTGGDDFFGGDLKGVTEKLDYLQGLGVTAIWFNPIFQSPSNHRYDTTDYSQIDPALGTLADFETLVAQAKARGIRIILDGVFNHVSSDSIYFDKFSRYPETGAYESQQSPYYDWFTFRTWPTKYNSWSNIDTLPVFSETVAVKQFFFLASDSVVNRWLKEGIGGWRLDAAEQKSHAYWQTARQAIKADDPNAIIIGEYWQNSAPWLAGDQWDGTMNYRFRDAVLDWLANPDHDVEAMAGKLDSIREDYPPQALAASMNLIDSHDTVRALTQAGGDKNMLMLMAVMQFTWPGMPTVYYGDEAGLEGNKDPDDRRTYPWGAEDQNLIAFYQMLGKTRHEWSALSGGEYINLGFDNAKDYYAYGRKDSGGRAIIVLTRSKSDQVVDLTVKDVAADGTVLMDMMNTGTQYTVQGGKISVKVGARWGALLVGK